MKFLVIAMMLMASGCGNANEVKDNRRCYMVETMSLGKVHCRKIDWTSKDVYYLTDCISEEGTRIGKIFNAQQVFNVCVNLP